MTLRGMGVLAMAALATGPAHAQSGEPHPKFPAADIRTAPVLNTGIIGGRLMRGGEIHGGRYEVRNASMLDLVSMAYDVDPDKVLGGPSWLELDRFNITAMVPKGSLPETANQMLQSLLADRFQLIVKQETKPMPAYALTVGKKLLLKESDGTGEPGCTRELKNPISSGGASDGLVMISSLTFVFHCKNTSVQAFMDQLPIPLPMGQQNRPVVDQTGLKGTWNFDLQFNTGPGVADHNPLIEALDKQLGLKMEAVDLPMPVVNVVSVNEKPTPDSPEDLKAFPPLPSEFDVAEIKPSSANSSDGPIVTARGGVVVARARGGRNGGIAFGPQLENGRLNIKGYTLQNLIMMAWDLPAADRLVNAPKWLDSDRYDVIAKVPQPVEAFSDLDSVKPMLQKLLMERFQLKVHSDKQPVQGFVLTSVKPKMKKADPSGRTHCINGVEPGEKDPRPGNPPAGRLITCRNMTMAQFADTLPGMAGGYFQGSTLFNETGLEGQWDFTFYFVAAGRAMGGRGVGADGMAADPSGGLSLFDAVNKLMGLKIESGKRPDTVLVIDHVEQKPTEN